MIKPILKLFNPLKTVQKRPDITWVKNTLDNLCHNHIRCWLEIPPCGTIDILLLSTTQYEINLPDISTKCEQCQVTITKNLKESPNEDIRELFQITLVQISNTTHFSPLEKCHPKQDKAKQRKLLDRKVRAKS